MDDLIPSYDKASPAQSDSEEDYGAVAKSKKRANRKTKVSAEVVLSMQDSDDESRDAKPAKPQKKPKVPRAKKAAPVQVEAHNMVKA
jgi:hypothetical protein